MIRAEDSKKLADLWTIFPGVKDPVSIFGRNVNELVINPDFRKKFSNLRSLCQDLANKKETIQEGYSIRFEPEFEVKGERTFEGAHLVLRNKYRDIVGILVFFVGFPMQIRFVQAIEKEKGRAKEFYEKTGKFFWEALIDRFISLAHKNFPEKEYTKQPKPRVAFIFRDEMNERLKRVILEKYCPREAILVISGTKAFNPKRMYVKERFFGRLRRGLPLDRKPRPLPKKKPF